MNFTLMSDLKTKVSWNKLWLKFFFIQEKTHVLVCLKKAYLATELSCEMRLQVVRDFRLLHSGFHTADLNKSSPFYCVDIVDLVSKSNLNWKVKTVALIKNIRQTLLSLSLVAWYIYFISLFSSFSSFLLNSRMRSVGIFWNFLAAYYFQINDILIPYSQKS